MSTNDEPSSDSEPSTILPEIGLSLRIASDDETWRVLAGQLRESLDAVYEHWLDLVATGPAQPQELLGARAKLTITRGELERHVHGIVRRVEDRGDDDDGFPIVRVHLVPELWLLSQRVDSRIFSGLDAVQIVLEVIRRAGVYVSEPPVVRATRSAARPLEPREYCVQYAESDLAFVSRLLEEEGLTFVFEQGEERERLVLVDGAEAAHSDLYPSVSTLGDEPVAFVTEQELLLRRRESIASFEQHGEIRPGRLALHDLDFTHYGLHAQEWVERTAAEPSAHGAVYEHPGRYQYLNAAGQVGAAGAFSATTGILQALLGVIPWPARASSLPLYLPAEPPPPPLPSYEGHVGGAIAAMRLQEIRARATELRGVGNVTGFQAGATFRLEGHPRAGRDGEYLLIEVVHEIHADDLRRGTEAGERPRPRYANRFTAIPRSVVHRPVRDTPRPRIHGTQTATVVGGPLEEVHVDAYGRIRIQLHWDRESTCERNLAHPEQALAGDASNPSRLAWVRVAQGWAGQGWGTWFVPRVGMEVVVTFLDGDPDRPLVVGSVYNSANPPPYANPAEFHRSTIKSRSVPSALKPPGRVGFNEIRFDDLANREEIWVHAERNLLENIRNDHGTWVGANQDNVVAGRQTNRVDEDQSETVRGNQAVNVGGDQSVVVSSGRAVSVAHSETHHVGRGRWLDVGDFSSTAIRGLHVHVVTPSSEPTLPAAAAAAQRQIGRIEHARRMNAALDPHKGTARDADGRDVEVEDDDDAGTPDTPPPLETYVVGGSRVKAVTGHESVSLGGRSAKVLKDDTLTVGGTYAARANTAIELSVAGEQLRELKGLAVQADPPRVNLFLGGDGMRMTTSALLVKRKDTSLTIDDDTLTVRAKSGVIHIFLGDDEDTEYGLAIEDDGATVKLASKDGSSCEVKSDVTVRAHGKLVLSNGGGARIEMAGNQVKVIAADIVLAGHVSTG